MTLEYLLAVGCPLDLLDKLVHGLKLVVYDVLSPCPKSCVWD